MAVGKGNGKGAARKDYGNETRDRQGIPGKGNIARSRTRSPGEPTQAIRVATKLAAKSMPKAEPRRLKPQPPPMAPPQELLRGAKSGIAATPPAPDKSSRPGPVIKTVLKR